ncbi:MAG: response regulator [Proteobacteria bacterium]|nr:response regulator [Pseudomonadota bacterium]
MKKSGTRRHDLSDERLRQTEESYRNFFENAVAGFAQIDPKGKCINVNKALAGIYGFESPEEMIKSFNIFGQDTYVNQEDQKSFIKILETQGVLKGYEIQKYRKDRSKIWLSMNMRSVRDDYGKTLYFECIEEDITEHKRLESQIIQSQKMEAVGTLAGGIAHDFNNLLMGIQGYTSLMLYSMEQNHIHYDKLKSIEDLVRSGADLTRQLLGFARSGKYEVKPVDLNEIIHKTCMMFRRTKKEITVHNKQARDIYTVEVDRGQMEQVMFNLFINAWQAMPAGGDLYIETKNISLDESYIPYTVKPGEYVKISVTDTGPGMDEKTKERIFEPFFTTKEMGRGSGLGLASVYGIIKNHNGFINVYSEKGHGTTFSIYLPALVKETRRRKTPAQTIKGSETILIVDDEDTVISVCRELLETLDYKVITAYSGKDAVEIYRSKKDEIDLVILDMIMPDMGGGETFEIMKIINPDIKVILSSGYSLNSQAAGIMNQGCKTFIQKPFSIGELSKKVREVLDSNDDE